MNNDINVNSWGDDVVKNDVWNHEEMVHQKMHYDAKKIDAAKRYEKVVKEMDTVKEFRDKDVGFFSVPVSLWFVTLPLYTVLILACWIAMSFRLYNYMIAQWQSLENSLIAIWCVVLVMVFWIYALETKRKENN